MIQENNMKEEEEEGGFFQEFLYKYNQFGSKC